jgi:hypothetical protein
MERDMKVEFIYQVRTNNKSNRIVRKYAKFNEIPVDHEDALHFTHMIANGLRAHEIENKKWVIAV